MSLFFSAPWMLVSVGAAAIPVILHFLFRQRARRVVFSSLRLLQDCRVQVVRRVRFQEALLMLVRALTLAAAALAFAHPVLRFSGAAPPLLGGRAAAAVVLDDSYSMRHRFNGVTAFERGQQKAAGLLRELKPGDRAAFICGLPVGGTPKLTDDLSLPRRAVEAAAPSYGANDLASAIQVAAGLVASATEPNREVHVFTDLQRTAVEQILSSPTCLRTLARARCAVQFTDVGASGPRPNIAVTEVTLASDRKSAAVTLRSFGPSPRRARVRITSGSAELGASEVQLPPRGSAVCRVPLANRASARTLAEARAPADELAADDLRYLSLPGRQAIRVLCLSGGGNRGSVLFVATALAPPGARSPAEVTLAPAAGLSGQDLRRWEVVVLADAVVDGQGWARLQAFVEDGGGLLALLGPAAARAAYTGAAPSVLPAGSFLRSWGSRGNPLRWSGFSPSHPVFQSLLEARGVGLDEVHFYSAQELRLEPGVARVLARFQHGAPALVERDVGRGRVMVLASACDTEAGDFVLHPAFVPWLHGAVWHLAEGSRSQESVLVGQPVFLPAQPADVGGRRLVTGPAGRVLSLTVRIYGRRPGLLLPPLSLPGEYRISAPEQPARAEGHLIANLDPAESDLAPASGEDLLRLRRAIPGAVIERPGGAVLAAAGRRGVPLWRMLLVMAVALAALDFALAQRLAARSHPRRTPQELFGR